uniref:Uncharacterized protein n=1 Tax=Chromera velia CCMP2878 TaxID=1169474 RepID=A0A0G4FD25_9ALVE|eukprot:Cvel_16433.t1-p1 / transcript=Cvel_16433.t1 / gene=Cvel_16433 / organism=Chromera_velia_CCMP2878 / gene_product=hypothetical protein / transcript_product=hypothetical protein / location=Cvel_scaffold1266:33568-40735(+) / protein_length=489 / sequence_SO=supercontig / SO=protein_coding / is_pseudo=false
MPNGSGGGSVVRELLRRQPCNVAIHELLHGDPASALFLDSTCCCVGTYLGRVNLLSLPESVRSLSFSVFEETEKGSDDDDGKAVCACTGGASKRRAGRTGTLVASLASTRVTNTSLSTHSSDAIRGLWADQRRVHAVIGDQFIHSWRRDSGGADTRPEDDMGGYQREENRRFKAWYMGAVAAGVGHFVLHSGTRGVILAQDGTWLIDGPSEGKGKSGFRMGDCDVAPLDFDGDGKILLAETLDEVTIRTVDLFQSSPLGQSTWIPPKRRPSINLGKFWRDTPAPTFVCVIGGNDLCVVQKATATLPSKEWIIRRAHRWDIVALDAPDRVRLLTVDRRGVLRVWFRSETEGVLAVMRIQLRDVGFSLGWPYQMCTVGGLVAISTDAAVHLVDVRLPRAFRQALQAQGGPPEVPAPPALLSSLPNRGNGARGPLPPPPTTGAAAAAASQQSNEEPGRYWSSLTWPPSQTGVADGALDGHGGAPPQLGSVGG